MTVNRERLDPRLTWLLGVLFDEFGVLGVYRAVLSMRPELARKPEPRATETAEEVEDAPAMQAPVSRGEAAARPTPSTSSAPQRAGEDPNPPASSPAPRTINRAQQRMMHAVFSALGIQDDHIGGRDERLRITSTIVGRQVTSSNDLTARDAHTLLDTLARCKTREDLEGVLDAIHEYQEGRV